LRIGLTIQMAKTKNAAPEPPDGSRALDQAILLLTNASADSLQKPEQLESLKAELTTRISAVYDGDVMEVLLTQFVIQ
jgi:flagellar basal body-associated protein FliL